MKQTLKILAILILVIITMVLTGFFQTYISNFKLTNYYSCKILIFLTVIVLVFASLNDIKKSTRKERLNNFLLSLVFFGSLIWIIEFAFTFIPISNQNMVPLSSHTWEAFYHRKFNNLGFRDVDVSQKNIDHREKLFFLGDSYADGFGIIDEIFVQPASGDAGISLGAAWMASVKNNEPPIPPKNTYLGNSFKNNEIKSILDSCQISYIKLDNPPLKAAELISKDNVIGWFQGKSEFGPRALGNRSILANALNPEMQKIVNQRIKLRASFRPFCPSVLEEDVQLMFEGKQVISPYMNITYDVVPAMKNSIPSAIHIDDTARIQTVNLEQNDLFYQLINHLKEITGFGIVLNTSFNLSHEPIVYSVRDALSTFFSSGLDYLFIDNFLISKNQNLAN